MHVELNSTTEFNFVMGQNFFIEITRHSTTHEQPPLELLCSNSPRALKFSSRSHAHLIKLIKLFYQTSLTLFRVISQLTVIQTEQSKMFMPFKTAAAQRAK